jgi:acyl carrier protein
LEFLGRMDHQVKIRGFRIELGEVEAALRQHPAVQQAVVLAREDVTGESLLVAYVVAPAAPPASEWRRFLREKLPDYMIPSAFLLLPGLPLTPNGKLDRNALPAPDRARPLAEEAFVAPRTSEEVILAGIWAEVLGVERVGAHDNFFDLGGHSLKATRVLARVQDAFQVQLSLASLFDNPTVADLAEAVARAPRGGAVQQGPALVPVPRGGHRVRATSAGVVENLDGLEEQVGQESRKR